MIQLNPGYSPDELPLFEVVTSHVTAVPLKEHHPDISLAIGEKHRIATAFGTTVETFSPF